LGQATTEYGTLVAALVVMCTTDRADGAVSARGDLWAVVLAAGWGRRGGRSEPRDPQVPDACSPTEDEGAALLRRTIDRTRGLLPAHRIVTVLPEAREPRPEPPGVPSQNVVWQRRFGEAHALVAGLLRVLVLGRRSSRLIVVRADHEVGDDAAWQQALLHASAAASRMRRVVIVGIRPKRWQGYDGCIVPAAPLWGQVLSIARLVPEPDARTGQALLAQGALVNSFTFAADSDILLQTCARKAGRTSNPLDLWRHIFARSSDLGVLPVPDTGSSVSAAVDPVPDPGPSRRRAAMN
jgi:mannose-1-phosphate guanylyltransferase